MSIRHDGQAYRRGVVFGFTVAEVVLLLVFCLLLLFMPVLLSDASKKSPAGPANPKTPPVASTRPASPGSTDGKPASPHVGSPGTTQREARPPLPEDWKVLVPEGTGKGREDGPNGPRDVAMAPPSGEPMPGLTLDAVCRKLGIPQSTCTVTSADASLHNAGRHNWPPIIPLKEADGYYFVVGSAQPSPEFTNKVRSAVVPEILQYAAQFQTDVIEVVGHTDEQPINGAGSNLDKWISDILSRGESGLRLEVADNAGLGFARAAAIVQILKGVESLKKMIILPLSAAQVVDTNGKLSDGTSGGDVKQRRRIEIRLRQSEPPTPK